MENRSVEEPELCILQQSSSKCPHRGYCGTNLHFITALLLDQIQISGDSHDPMTYGAARRSASLSAPVLSQDNASAMSTGLRRHNETLKSTRSTGLAYSRYLKSTLVTPTIR